MKKLGIICFFILMMSIKVLAQVGDTVKKDSASIFYGPDMRPITKSKFIYVIDGKQYVGYHVRKNLVTDTSDILEVKVLKGKDVAPYGKLGNNGVVIITSKQFAIKACQKKLSAFSDVYKKYIIKHGNDDKLVYMLNNTILQIDKKSLSELYNLQPADIKKVTFKTDSRFANDATVVIITNDAENN